MNQEPGPTDMSAGVMTRHKKNLLNLYALLCRQGRLLLLCMRQCAESCVEKKPTGVTNSSEFKEVTTLTHVSFWIRRCKTGTRLLNPRIQLTIGSEVSVKSVADSYILWFTLISP